MGWYPFVLHTSYRNRACTNRGQIEERESSASGAGAGMGSMCVAKLDKINPATIAIKHSDANVSR